MQKQVSIFLSIALAGIFLGILAGSFFSLVHDLPQINHLKQFKPSSVTTVFSADKQVLTQFYIEKRFPVSLDIIPKHLIHAIVTIEDRNFYTHSGVHLKAILRAIFQDLKARQFKQGASTLTQQLAKTLFLSSEKSIARKIKEAIITFQIERRYTKDEILELYLNLIYLGSGAYGVEAASQTYFNKSVKDLTLAQAALIAGLPKAPSVYSPLTNPDLAEKRRNVVLHQMLATHRITSQEYHLAIAAEIDKPSRETTQVPAACFIDYIKADIQKNPDLKEIYSTGLNIHTSLNLGLQLAANQSVVSRMTELELRMKQQGLDPSKAQCGVIAIDIKTGGILGMVGGKADDKSMFNRAVQARRQPGSAFKPFVYATAVTLGFSQTDRILDAPLSYQLPGSQTWEVDNYSKTFAGEISLRKALALSKNTPAIRLIETLGPAKVVEFARKSGMTSDLHPNLSLALGTSEVSLIELTAAYIPFANMGIRVEPSCIVTITDSDSRVIYQNSIKKQSIMTRQDAAVMADMLKAVILEGTGRDARVIQKEIAGKTGTTDDYKDALFVGFSPDIALGVWVGNDDSRSLGNLETGAKAALPIWIDVMQYFLLNNPTQYFDIPDQTKVVYMDPDTGRITNGKDSQSIKALIHTKDVQ